MIILRQKEFISQEYYEKVRNRVQRRAFWGTAGDAAKGAVKNASKQAVGAISHPGETLVEVGKGVGKKIGNSWKSLGATFGIGKDAKEMSTSQRARNIVHFASPTARRAINIHDSAAHVLGKNGDSVVDSLARFKATPISYIGAKTDTLARVGAFGTAGSLAGKVGMDKVASTLNKAQGTTGGTWLGFDAKNVAGFLGKNQLSRGGTVVANTAGKITGYTTGERPGGLFEEIGKAVTRGKESEITAEVAAFKNTKKAKRAAQYVDRLYSPWANKIAAADRKVVGTVASGINRAGETVRAKTAQAKRGVTEGVIQAGGSIATGIKGIFARKNQPQLQPVMASAK